MSLSCSCDYGDLSDYAWMHEGPSDFKPFNEHNPSAKRRHRCASCRRTIDMHEECVRFDRVRAPKSDIEERIFGEEVRIAPIWHCEDCASIYVNLYELGYNCMDPSQPVQDYLKEYWGMTGFDPKKYAREGA